MPAHIAQLHVDNALRHRPYQQTDRERIQRSDKMTPIPQQLGKLFVYRHESAAVTGRWSTTVKSPSRISFLRAYMIHMPRAAINSGLPASA